MNVDAGEIVADTTSSWTFLTNHSHVLLVIWRTPDVRVREIASLVGITERAVMRIIGELHEAGFIRIEKYGRENRYSVIEQKPLRHPLEASYSVGDLLKALSKSEVALHA